MDASPFSSPVGEVVSYIGKRRRTQRLTKFPSPIGEVVSYMLNTNGYNDEYEKFPSPIGEVVSYISVVEQAENPLVLDGFPSPIGEVVSYILPLPDGSVMRQKWAFAAENRFECITTLLSL